MKAFKRLQISLAAAALALPLAGWVAPFARAESEAAESGAPATKGADETVRGRRFLDRLGAWAEGQAEAARERKLRAEKRLARKGNPKPPLRSLQVSQFSYNEKTGKLDLKIRDGAKNYLRSIHIPPQLVKNANPKFKPSEVSIVARGDEFFSYTIRDASLPKAPHGFQPMRDFWLTLTSADPTECLVTVNASGNWKEGDLDPKYLPTPGPYGKNANIPCATWVTSPEVPAAAAAKGPVNPPEEVSSEHAGKL